MMLQSGSQLTVWVGAIAPSPYRSRLFAITLERRILRRSNSCSLSSWAGSASRRPSSGLKFLRRVTGSFLITSMHRAAVRRPRNEYRPGCQCNGHPGLNIYTLSVGPASSFRARRSNLRSEFGAFACRLEAMTQSICAPALRSCVTHRRNSTTADAVWNKHYSGVGAS